MIDYANSLISISMNINENFKNERKIVEKFKGLTYKITNILPAMRPSKSNLVPNQCLVKVLSPYGQIGKIFNLNIHGFQ